MVAPLAGAWIEMIIYDRDLRGYRSRSPCGSVDRNIYSLIYVPHASIVAPLAGAWIEIRSARIRKQHKKSLPLRERG